MLSLYSRYISEWMTTVPIINWKWITECCSLQQHNSLHSELNSLQNAYSGFFIPVFWKLTERQNSYVDQLSKTWIRYITIVISENAVKYSLKIINHIKLPRQWCWATKWISLTSVHNLIEKLRIIFLQNKLHNWHILAQCTLHTGSYNFLK